LQSILRDGLRVDAQVKRIAGMSAGLDAPAGELAMLSAGEAADPPKYAVNLKSHLRWWGVALGAAIALGDALLLKWFGVNLTSHGHDVMWPVVAWFGLWFAVLGFMLGKTLDDRRHARTTADLIRAQINELAASRERLVQSEKLAALGTLAAAIAHEVRNPLAVIRSAAQSMGEAAPAEAGETRRACRFMMEEADRLASLVNSLLAFARPARLSAQAVAAAELFDRALLLARGELESRQVRIERRESPPNAVASADPNLITQVLAGLLTNAAQAAPIGGEVRIECRAEASTVELAVEDSGPGVPAALRDRIFEPFFTTRASGVGLGLAIARQITEAHGGSIRLGESSSGGARFSVILPRAAVP
jgi:signal transduction histidine kinase